jgi:hypothetical protein
VSHPSLGLPPRDLTAGRPASGDAIRVARSRLAARALEVAIEADPTIRTRYDELGLRRLLHDCEVLLDQVATAAAAGDTSAVTVWAETVVPLFRRRNVPMDDLVALAEGSRRAIAASLVPGEDDTAQAALDEAVRVFRWHRRIAGDARRRNRLLHALYKGA